MPANKGQIMIAIVGAVSAVIVSVLTNWGATKSRINAVDTRVQLVERTEQNHYLELSKQMEKLDVKLDRLIDQQITKSNVKK